MITLSLLCIGFLFLFSLLILTWISWCKYQVDDFLAFIAALLIFSLMGTLSTQIIKTAQEVDKKEK